MACLFGSALAEGVADGVAEGDALGEAGLAEDEGDDAAADRRAAAGA